MPPPARSPRRQRRRRVRAFTLVEVTLALGIAASCLVVLLGLLPTGLNAIRAGKDETDALQRLGAVLADVRATPIPAAPFTDDKSIRYKLDLTGADPAVKEFLLDEQGNVPADSRTARYRVGYSVVKPAAGANCARLYLRISWPGAAAAGRGQGMSEIFVTVNRNS